MEEAGTNVAREAIYVWESISNKINGSNAMRTTYIIPRKSHFPPWLSVKK
jgi:hypothetical protein